MVFIVGGAGGHILHIQISNVVVTWADRLTVVCSKTVVVPGEAFQQVLLHRAGGYSVFRRSRRFLVALLYIKKQYKPSQ